MIRTTLTLAALPALVAIAPGAVSAQTFSAPKGCEVFLTVQTRACSVSHHFTCAGDPEGDQWRADLDEEGTTFIGRIDFETQWLESFFVLSGGSERLISANDPASFSELLAVGSDSYDFVTQSETGETFRYLGKDRLTGDDTVINGVELLGTEYRIQGITEAGDIFWESRGFEFISPEFRFFVGGISNTVLPDGEVLTEDGSPMEIIFPGEPGFLSSSPKYDCGATTLSFEVTE